MWGSSIGPQKNKTKKEDSNPSTGAQIVTACPVQQLGKPQQEQKRT